MKYNMHYVILGDKTKKKPLTVQKKKERNKQRKHKNLIFCMQRKDY